MSAQALVSSRVLRWGSGDPGRTCHDRARSRGPVEARVRGLARIRTNRARNPGRGAGAAHAPFSRTALVAPRIAGGASASRVSSSRWPRMHGRHRVADAATVRAYFACVGCAATRCCASTSALRPHPSRWGGRRVVSPRRTCRGDDPRYGPRLDAPVADHWQLLVDLLTGYAGAETPRPRRSNCGRLSTSLGPAPAAPPPPCRRAVPVYRARPCPPASVPVRGRRRAATGAPHPRISIAIADEDAAPIHTTTMESRRTTLPEAARTLNGIHGREWAAASVRRLPGVAGSRRVAHHAFRAGAPLTRPVNASLDSVLVQSCIPPDIRIVVSDARGTRWRSGGRVVKGPLDQGIGALLTDRIPRRGHVRSS